MEATINSNELQEALGKILSILDKKSSIRPMISYAFLNISNDSINIQATDMEVTAKITMKVKVEAEAQFCIDAKKLFDAVRWLPDKYVRIELKDNALNVGSENIHYSLLVYKSDDYPNLMLQHEGKTFQIESRKIQDIISKISHAISSDETRMNLNGIFLCEYDGKLRSVSTDGHRFSMIDTIIDKSDLEIFRDGVIIPKKGVFELKKMAENDKNSSITISIDDTFLYASINDCYFLSVRLIARTYPNYQNAIPTNPIRHFFVDKNLLLDAVRRVKIMSNEKSYGVRIKLAPSQMEVLANDPLLGKAYEKIPIKYDGENIEIGLNANYLIDSLSIFEQGDVKFQLNNDIMPVLVRPSDRSDYLAIIMPLKL